MGHFFDEAARILASQMPRREALKRLGGALVAAIVSTFGSTHLAAEADCPPPCANGRNCCGGHCCGDNQRCEDGRCQASEADEDDDDDDEEDDGEDDDEEGDQER